MLKWFNAIQIMALLIGLPFLIQFLSNTEFYGVLAVKSVVIVTYVVLVIYTTILYRNSMDS